MEYVIGGLILILVLYITGYFLKKKYYKEIDRLEAWKIEVMNRPVLDEMSKVKKLNMTGQTEELFEKWRKEWDEIVTSFLPDVEEYLFDAEECIDKYRFNKAKVIQKAIENQLSETDDRIYALIDEITDLVGSEEKSRIEIEELKEIYRSNKKTLLAHRHHYGEAEQSLEAKLDELILSFQYFEDLTENGNYLDARETIVTIKANLEDISWKLEIIPNLLVECQSKIPSQIHEIKEGFREMEQQGYFLNHIGLDTELGRIEKELSTYKQSLERTELENVEQGIEDIKTSIELLYDLLEEEVNSKVFIHDNEEVTRELLHTATTANTTLKKEVETVKQSYHLSENHLGELIGLETRLVQLSKRYELVQHKIKQDETAYSLIRDELTDIKAQLEKMNMELNTFSENLQMLRKDELAVREKLQELSKNMADTIKLVSRSNIPGVPQDLIDMIDESKKSLQDVKLKLEEKPLNISSVQGVLEVAIDNVDRTSTLTHELMETVMLVEKVIQYGNRYRSRYPSVEKGLKEAEKSFRGFDYQTALEQAAASVEEIEPGALKKIEALLEEQGVTL